MQVGQLPDGNVLALIALTFALACILLLKLIHAFSKCRRTHRAWMQPFVSGSHAPSLRGVFWG